MKDQSLITSAYRAAYAMARLGDISENKVLADVLRGRGVGLLEAALNKDLETINSEASAIFYVLQFSVDAALLPEAQIRIALSELDAFRGVAASLSIIDKDINPGSLEEDMKALAVPGEEKHVSDYKNQVRQPKKMNQKNGSREESIIGAIRQMGTCRMRDIQQALPEVSERTLRYDLGGLLARNVISRSGNTGPGTFYRLNEAQPLSLPVMMVDAAGEKV